MRLIEIQEGVVIDASKIESVRKPDSIENRTMIFTHHRKYATSIPFETIIAMLREEESVGRNVSSDERVKNTMDKLDKVLGSVGHFAG